MKKIGILSMQRIANYGSFLQAYGLKCILEEFGCKVQFVDYHPGKTLIPADGGTGLKRKISKVCEVFKSRAPFFQKLRFIKYKKSYTSLYYPYLGITQEKNYAPELDVLVIGSDEVFNCVQNNTNVGFSPELFGAENKAKKLISYAASFGNTTYEKLKNYKVEGQIAKWLERFDAISVRDENSYEIVRKLTNNTPTYHLDPVLMYEFGEKCNEIPKHVSDDNYMILYGYSGRFTTEECKCIRDYVKEKKLRVFCIGGVQECCDRFIDCSPFEVIAYFQHAACVVTDTFHGTILSVITHRIFATVIRNSGYGNAEKLTDLLNRLELKERKIEDLHNVKDIMEKPIKYENVDRIIIEERNRCRQYLREQISKI